MSLYRLRELLLLITVLVTLSACQSVPNTTQTDRTPTGDLEKLYAEPSIIGTSPKKPVWSADAQHVVFLWNDDGQTFRDVWSYSLQTGEKQRLTWHANEPHKHDFAQTGGHLGISEVVWLNADEGILAYVLDGRLYFKTTAHPPQHAATEQTGISNLSLSPNGRHLAYVADGSLWVRSSDISNIQAAQRLVERAGAKAYIESFTWSNDSQNLAFKHTDNSPLPERVIYYDANNDLQKYQVQRAFPGEKTALFRTGVVGLDGSSRYFNRPDDTHYIWGYGLSADGQSFFINSSDLLVKEHTVYVYDVATGARTVYYHEYDAKHLRPDWQVAWAPRDNGLIILTDKDGYLHLYHQSNAGGELKALTSGQWEINTFAVDHINEYIYFTANKAHLAERQLYRVKLNNPSNSNIERISPATPGTHQFKLSPDQNQATSLFSHDSKPMELYVTDLNNSITTQITDSPLPAFHQIPWAHISYVEFESHLDGTHLVGRLSLPAHYDASKKYPLIVGSVYSDSVRNQFGGRTSHPTWGLDQYLTSQGYILLNVNVRGSWGQGREHNQGLRYGYGVIDIEDLHSGVKYLIEAGLVDPERVGIWGSSYGGLMTMMSLFKKPGVYAAGIAGAPATNVAHAYPGQMWVMGEPTGTDQPERYQNQSPLYHTDGLEDPLMIIHGSKDPVVLYADTIAVTEKLIAQQSMFELVTLPGTSHGWDNEGNDVRLFAFKKMIEFFDRHLKH